MKIRILLTAVVLILVSPLVSAEITDVFISPQEPIEIDPITIITSGVENSGAVVIESSSFMIDGTSLELDIYLEVGSYTVMTPWQHSEDIGTLLMGTYDLTVNTINELEPEFNDTYYTSFEVIPEPATILLFGLGGLIFRS
ncbi:MAG: PEP-CTERM sorting domain-containing protein [Planctomycetota bacterium]|jgi:hypothetical protein